MKKNVVTTIIGIASLFLLSTVAMRHAVAADDTDTATVNITAIVQATCTLTVSTKTVDLGNIPVSDFTVSPGTLLINHRQSFTVTPNCLGGDNYKLTLVPSSANGRCIGTNKDFIAFCLATDKGDFDFSNGSPVLYPDVVSNEEIKISVTPQFKGGEIKGGTISDSSVTITIDAS